MDTKMAIKNDAGQIKQFGSKKGVFDPKAPKQKNIKKTGKK